MRAEYIEREAALDIVNDWRNQLIPTYGENDEYVKCLETVAEHLESLHAADVRPVARGKWIHFSRSDECSVCGYDTGKYEAPTWFCPNCGADMRGET